MAAFFSLANDRITRFERYRQAESHTFWYSYITEQFCVEHVYKIAKFLPDTGLSRLLLEGDTQASRFGYSSLEVIYLKVDTSGSQRLEIVVRA